MRHILLLGTLALVAGGGLTVLAWLAGFTQWSRAARVTGRVMVGAASAGVLFGVWVTVLVLTLAWVTAILLTAREGLRPQEAAAASGATRTAQ